MSNMLYSFVTRLKTQKGREKLTEIHSRTLSRERVHVEATDAGRQRT